MKKIRRREDIVYKDPIFLGKEEDASGPVGKTNMDNKGYKDLMFFTPNVRPVAIDANVATETEAEETDPEIQTPMVQPKPKRGAAIVRLILIIAITLVVVVVLVFGIISLRRWAHEEPKGPEPTPTVAASQAPSKDDAIEKAKNLLKENGWKDGEYVLEVVDPSKDSSTTGDGAFTKEGIKNVGELLVFLNSGESSATALLKRIAEQTNTTREELLNNENWVVVQSNVPFKYPGNTSYKNGAIVDVGTRNGSSGDIFMLFISPKSDSGVAVRGACANPQEEIPKPPTPTPAPSKPTPTPTTAPTPTLQPKSSNPADYKKPGDDKKTDAGTGIKPPVPTVSTPAELTPPLVNTVVPTKAIVAPNATPLPTQVPKATPTPTLAPEPSVNPTDGAPNSGDPGNPFE